MKSFQGYLHTIEDNQKKLRVEDIFNWIKEKFPELEEKITWNQPVFIEHGTFIIGFSVSNHHLAISPEQTGITQFTDEIAAAGYQQSKMLFRIKWNEPVNFLKDYIVFIKQNYCSTFPRSIDVINFD